MELEDFRKDFLETVRATAASEGDFEEASFVAETGRRLVEAEELGDFEPCYLELAGSRNRRMRIDGFSFDDVDGSVSLVVANFSGQDEIDTLTQTDASRYFSMLRTFIEDSLSGRLHQSLEESSPSFAISSDLFHRKESLTRFRAILVTDCLLSSRIKDWPEEDLAGIPIEFHIWDIARFHRVFESGIGRDELEINFSEFQAEGIPCLEASQGESDYRSYLCILPATILADVYDRFGSRLLEGNVRSFLSTKGKVNRAIRSSIINEPGMFFAYNNGIAATATAARVEMGDRGLRLVEVQNLQIVNGGQTTASIANTRRIDKQELKDVFVQMKLSVISPEKSEEIIPKISYCANSQNKVSEADFFSNHPFHVRMEEISRRLWAPAASGAQYETHWFYERARGQYLNEQLKLSTGEKNKFLRQNPREHVITKTDLAKFENAWNGQPHIVSQGAQKNFLSFAQSVGEKWKTDDVNFNDEYFRNATAKGILFRHTERLVSRQPWYQNGYRANIVAYTVAKLAQVIDSSATGYSLDMHSIWTRQDISSALESQLTKISKAVFDVIVTPAQGFQNVTEWCKKDACWQRVRDLRVTLDDDFRRELIDKEKVRFAKKDAKAQRQIDSGIEVQTEVVKLGAAYWARLGSWGKSKKLLSATESQIIDVAAKMPRMIPSERQSAILVEIKRRLEEDGFGSDKV